MKTKNKIDIKEVQTLLLRMATEIKNILEAGNIPYWITYGTLLGAVRHQGFIPWDDDFDFYLFEDTYNDAISLLKERLPVRYFVEDEDSEPLFYHGWVHVKDTYTEVDHTLYPQDGIYSNKGLSIDLYKAFFRDETTERSFRITQHIEYLNRKLNKGLIPQSSYDQKISCLKKTMEEKKESGTNRKVYIFPSIYNDRIYPEELFPLKKYKFENTYFYGPNNADIFLKRCYGDYMELPTEDKRKPHYETVIMKV